MEKIFKTKSGAIKDYYQKKAKLLDFDNDVQTLYSLEFVWCFDALHTYPFQFNKI